MRRMRRSHVAFAALLTASSVAKAAHADPTPVDLEWGAPPGCPRQADVERDIARTIGGRPVGREPLRARVDGWRSEGGGWKGEVVLAAGGEAARREVHGDTCAAVESAVAIVIGVAAVHDAIPSSERVPVAARAPAAPPPAARPPEPPPFPTHTLRDPLVCFLHGNFSLSS
jgi:hypothetical protein